MAETDVAQALRKHAARIRACMPGEQNEDFEHMMGWVASQFEQLAAELDKPAEPLPLAQAIAQERIEASWGSPSEVEKLVQLLPQCTQNDLCRVAGHPRGLHTQDGKTKLPNLRIVSPVGISGLGGGGGNTVHVASSGGVSAGGGGGSSWMPVLTVSAHRIELAAEAAYKRMARGQQHFDWAHLDERDRQSWRDAVSDAMQAALSAEWTS